MVGTRSNELSDIKGMYILFSGGFFPLYGLE